MQGVVEKILNFITSDLKIPNDILSLNVGESLYIKPPTGKKWHLMNLYAGIGTTNDDMVVTVTIIDGETEVCKYYRLGMCDLPDLKPFYLTENHFLKITNESSHEIKVSYEALEYDL